MGQPKEKDVQVLRNRDMRELFSLTVGGVSQRRIYREVRFGLSFEEDRDRPSLSGKEKANSVVRKEFFRRRQP